jgi:hypothetical protein
VTRSGKLGLSIPSLALRMKLRHYNGFATPALAEITFPCS